MADLNGHAHERTVESPESRAEATTHDGGVRDTWGFAVGNVELFEMYSPIWEAEEAARSVAWEEYLKEVAGGSGLLHYQGTAGLDANGLVSGASLGLGNAGGPDAVWQRAAAADDVISVLSLEELVGQGMLDVAVTTARARPAMDGGKGRLTELVEGGVPFQMRGEAWKTFLDISVRKQRGYYKDLVEHALGGLKDAPRALATEEIALQTALAAAGLVGPGMLDPGGNEGDMEATAAAIGAAAEKRYEERMATKAIQKTYSGCSEVLSPYSKSDGHSWASSGKVWLVQIEKDLPRTFPGHPLMRDSGRWALRRVLAAYALHNRNVGYCQGLNFVAGTLLLFMGEEDCFYCLSAIVEDILVGYYAQDMLATQIDQRVFKHLIMREFTEVDQHLEAVGADLSCVFAQWFLCLYVNFLPLESCLRIWDLLFYHRSSAVMFQVSLSLLNIYSSALTATDDILDALQVIQSIAPLCFDSSRLVHVAFSSFTHIREPELDKLREQYKKDVLADLSAIANRRTAVKKAKQPSSESCAGGGGKGGVSAVMKLLQKIPSREASSVNRSSTPPATMESSDRANMSTDTANMPACNSAASMASSAAMAQPTAEGNSKDSGFWGGVVSRFTSGISTTTSNSPPPPCATAAEADATNLLASTEQLQLPAFDTGAGLNNGGPEGGGAQRPTEDPFAFMSHPNTLFPEHRDFIQLSSGQPSADAELSIPDLDELLLRKTESSSAEQPETNLRLKNIGDELWNPGVLAQDAASSEGAPESMGGAGKSAPNIDGDLAPEAGRTALPDSADTRANSGHRAEGGKPSSGPQTVQAPQTRAPKQGNGPNGERSVASARAMEIARTAWRVQQTLPPMRRAAPHAQHHPPEAVQYADTSVPPLTSSASPNIPGVSTRLAKGEVLDEGTRDEWVSVSSPGPNHAAHGAQPSSSFASATTHSSMSQIAPTTDEINAVLSSRGIDALLRQAGTLSTRCQGLKQHSSTVTDHPGSLDHPLSTLPHQKPFKQPSSNVVSSDLVDLFSETSPSDPFGSGRSMMMMTVEEEEEAVSHLFGGTHSPLIDAEHDASWLSPQETQARLAVLMEQYQAWSQKSCDQLRNMAADLAARDKMVEAMTRKTAELMVKMAEQDERLMYQKAHIARLEGRGPVKSSWDSPSGPSSVVAPFSSHRHSTPQREGSLSMTSSCATGPSAALNGSDTVLVDVYRNRMAGSTTSQISNMPDNNRMDPGHWTNRMSKIFNFSKKEELSELP